MKFASKIRFYRECISGVTYEGTAIGEIKKIGGFDTYVSKPTGDYPKDKAVLFLTDIFGIEYINNKLLVDDFARNGFQCYAPDIHGGNAIPEDALSDPDFLPYLYKWFSTRDATATPRAMYGVIHALKQEGITSIAAVGYCYGARYAFNLAFENLIKVIVVTHASLLVIPADIERLLATSQAPLLINQAENDQMFPEENFQKAKGMLGDGKYKPGFETTYWPGTDHGFAVRGDLSKPGVKKGKEGAFKATVEFFIKHL